MSKLSRIINEEYAKLVERADDGKKYKVMAEGVRSLVREEFEAMLKELEPNRPKIAEKLETLRTRLIKDGMMTKYIRGQALWEYDQRPEVRIPVATVAELIQFPISEVTLYFLNGHRIHEGHVNIEYHMGAVRFYGDASPEK